MRRFAGMALGIALTATLLAGCSHVRPWQREHMARIESHQERTASAERYQTHLWSVREAAVGGSGKALGGCGCN